MSCKRIQAQLSFYPFVMCTEFIHIISLVTSYVVFFCFVGGDVFLLVYDLCNLARLVSDEIVFLNALVCEIDAPERGIPFP